MCTPIIGAMNIIIKVIATVPARPPKKNLKETFRVLASCTQTMLGIEKGYK
jgi:hypothetical protein